MFVSNRSMICDFDAKKHRNYLIFNLNRLAPVSIEIITVLRIFTKRCADLGHNLGTTGSGERAMLTQSRRRSMLRQAYNLACNLLNWILPCFPLT